MSHYYPSTTGSRPHCVVVRRKTTTSAHNENLARFHEMSPAHDSANKKLLEAPAYSAVGGSLGCVFGFGALAIPEVGSFTAGMPMTTALLGAAAGAVGGWMIRWVFHWR